MFRSPIEEPVTLPSNIESHVEGSKPGMLIVLLFVIALWIVPHSLLPFLRWQGRKYNPATEDWTGKRVGKMRLG